MKKCFKRALILAMPDSISMKESAHPTVSCCPSPLPKTPNEKKKKKKRKKVCYVEA
jgi:hypothetical protein